MSRSTIRIEVPGPVVAVVVAGLVAAVLSPRCFDRIWGRHR